MRWIEKDGCYYLQFEHGTVTEVFRKLFPNIQRVVVEVEDYYVPLDGESKTNDELLPEEQQWVDEFVKAIAKEASEGTIDIGCEINYTIYTATTRIRICTSEWGNIWFKDLEK